jgi:threonyl-tRNA synthetase
MPNIRLPDGSSKSFPTPVTVAEIAASIGAGLARAALAGKVNGKLVDTVYRVGADADVSIITERDAEGVDLLRHSTAHLLAHDIRAVEHVRGGPLVHSRHPGDVRQCRGFLQIDFRHPQPMRCARALKPLI